MAHNWAEHTISSTNKYINVGDLQQTYTQTNFGLAYKQKVQSTIYYVEDMNNTTSNERFDPSIKSKNVDGVHTWL